MSIRTWVHPREFFQTKKCSKKVDTENGPLRRKAGVENERLIWLFAVFFQVGSAHFVKLFLFEFPRRWVAKDGDGWLCREIDG